MIYTLTLNPSVDLMLESKKITLGEINRVKEKNLVPGGKGINVSLMLSELGIKNTALGFTGGFSGDMIESELTRKNTITDFVRLPDGFSRINVKLNAEEETEINCEGPDIDAESIEKLYEKISQINKGDIITLCGHFGATLPSDIYVKIAETVKNNGAELVCDVQGKDLEALLKFRPLVIKPNKAELEDMFKRKAENLLDVKNMAFECIKMGAKNVLVSLGVEGAILVNSFMQYTYLPAFSVEVKNTTGCGDSMLAGYLAGKVQGFDDLDCLRLGIAAGSSTARYFGIAEGKDVMECFGMLRSKCIS